MPNEIKWRWKRLSWLFLTLFVIVADQLTKWIVLNSIHPGVIKPFIPGFFNWTLAFNTGAAFSFLAHESGWQLFFFLAVALIICLLLLVWLVRSKWISTLDQCAIALVVGGAIGNVIDRIRLGHVVDFVQIHYHAYYWPTFNVADSFVCIGAVILVISSLVRPSHDKN